MSEVSTPITADHPSLLDLRSLALMRIGCAGICLFDLIARAFALRAQYTSEGVLPLRNYLWQPDLSWRFWSVYFWSDSPLFVAALFVCTGLCAILLLFGYRTRLATPGLWILVLSLHHRNILVINGGDHYLRMLLFWGMFLPWGRCFSIDSRASDRRGERPVSSSRLAGWAYTIQVAMVYLFNGLYKTSAYWTSDGSAIYRALYLSEIGYGLGRHLLWLGSLLVPLALAVRLLELALPVLIILPAARTRLVAVGILASFHLGILLTMRVELFSIVGLVGLLGLLPTTFWRLSPAAKLDRALDRLADSAARRFRSLGIQIESTRASHDLWSSWFATGLIACALSFVVVQSGLDYLAGDRWKAELGYGRVLGLYVKWSMFAPGPPGDSWYSAPVITRNGVEIDLLTGQPPCANKLQTVEGYSRWGRWKSYRSSIRGGDFGSNAQEIGRAHV